MELDDTAKEGCFQTKTQTLFDAQGKKMKFGHRYGAIRNNKYSRWHYPFLKVFFSQNYYFYQTTQFITCALTAGFRKWATSLSFWSLHLQDLALDKTAIFSGEFKKQSHMYWSIFKHGLYEKPRLQNKLFKKPPISLYCISPSCSW